MEQSQSIYSVVYPVVSVGAVSLLNLGLLFKYVIIVLKIIENIPLPSPRPGSLAVNPHWMSKKLKSYLNKSSINLLYGVTGSGKTEVYIDVVTEVIKNGKDAIILVPEISLTPQITARFKGIFKDNIAILHSSLSDGERFDEIRKIRKTTLHL